MPDRFRALFPRFAMTKLPCSKVAVVTRTYDRPLLLRRACKSILEQSFRDFLWVIANNGGSPGPVEEVAALAREQGVSVLVHHIEATGIEAASNAAIASCGSEYVVIHDDDDRWAADFLSATVEFLDSRPALAGVVTASIQVKERIEGDAVIELSRAPFNPWVQGIQLVDMAQRNLFPPIALLFRRSAWEVAGGFDEGLPVLGDWDFNLKVLRRADLGFIPRSLAYYHIRPSVAADQAAYGNTVTAGLSKFQEYDPLIRNRMLRADLECGRVGLGWLVAMGRQHNAMWEVLRSMDANLRKHNDKTG